MDAAIYKKWMKNPLRRDDVIMTSEAPLGELAYLNQSRDWVLGQRLFAIRPRRNVLSGKFLYYVLATQSVRDAIIARASGTTVQGIRQAELRKVEIPVPPLDVQIAASEILEVLDNRIDIIRQTNATFEAIAQALFKSWFVDFDPVRAKAKGREPEGMGAATAALFPSEFEDSELGHIPKGWRVGNLGQCCDNIRSQAKPEMLDPDTPYIGLEHMPRGSITLSDWGTADGLASGKFWYRPNDVLFGKLRPYFHKVGVASHEGVCSTDILVIRTKRPTWFSFSAMHLSGAPLISYATQLSNGAKMPRTNWQDLAAYKVAMPDDASVSAFDSVVRPMIERIHAAIEAMRSLRELRDTLLPRLISGKLRLPEAEREVEAALA